MQLRITPVLAVAFLTAALSFCGCKPAHQDEKSAVVNALGNNGLYSVIVAQDRDKGVITLTGDVGSAAVKAQAESVSAKAAPDYTITNNIHVIALGPPPSSAGSAH
jgi:hyperosmotically inducible protein